MKRNESHMTGIDKQSWWRKRGQRTNSKQYYKASMPCLWQGFLLASPGPHQNFHSPFDAILATSPRSLYEFAIAGQWENGNLNTLCINVLTWGLLLCLKLLFCWKYREAGISYLNILRCDLPLRWFYCDAALNIKSLRGKNHDLFTLENDHRGLGALLPFINFL